MNATRVALAVLVAAVSLDCAAADCSAQKAFLCSDAGCEAVSHDFFIVLNDSKPAVLRCDKNGCDQIDVQASVSGLIKTYAAPSRGYFLRLNSVDRSFVEIATQMTSVLIKYGVCVE